MCFGIIIGKKYPIYLYLEHLLYSVSVPLLFHAKYAQYAYLFIHKRKFFNSYFSIPSNFINFPHLFFIYNCKTKRKTQKICQKRIQLVTKHCIISLDENTIALDDWKLHGNMLVIVIYARIHFWTNHLRDNINRRSRMQITNCFKSKK